MKHGLTFFYFLKNQLDLSYRFSFGITDQMDRKTTLRLIYCFKRSHFMNLLKTGEQSQPKTKRRYPAVTTICLLNRDHAFESFKLFPEKFRQLPRKEISFPFSAALASHRKPCTCTPSSSSMVPKLSGDGIRETNEPNC